MGRGQGDHPAGGPAVGRGTRGPGDGAVHPRQAVGPEAASRAVPPRLRAQGPSPVRHHRRQRLGRHIANGQGERYGYIIYYTW